MGFIRVSKAPVVVLMVLLLAASCGGGSSKSSSTSTTSASSSSSSAGQGSAAVCAALGATEEFSQLASGIATKTWPQVQALFAAQKDAIASAFAVVESSAPSSIVADVRTIAAFTSRAMAAAATAQSPEQWAQVIAADPGAAESAAAGNRLNTFAKDTCGLDLSSTGSSSS
jgi:hypothetical protein